MHEETKDRKISNNEITIAHWLPTWINYAVENRPFIKALAKKLKKDLIHGTGTYQNVCISSIVKRPMVPALIVGSGPSLDDMLPYIKEFPGVVICGATNARTVAASGRNPDYICCLDSNGDTWKAMGAHGYDWGETMLITHPSISPDILKNWKGPVRFFRPMQMGHPFFDDIYPKMYDFIDFGLVNAGCTVNTECEIATLLGCTPMVIAGVDFGFTDGRARCAQFEWEEGIQNNIDGTNTKKWGWVRKPDPPLQTRSAMRRSRAGCMTTEEMGIYKQNFFLLARTEATTVYSVSRGIIRPEEVCGYVRPEELNAALKMGKLVLADPKEIEVKYDAVLAEFGVRIEEGENGIVRVMPLKTEEKGAETKPESDKKVFVFEKPKNEGIKRVEKKA
jgi:hypothetical protein